VRKGHDEYRDCAAVRRRVMCTFVDTKKKRKKKKQAKKRASATVPVRGVLRFMECGHRQRNT